ncbi:MAG: hypothetical protein QOH21_2361, partial [Acidobacteriota bacterium]|nr:hypothetical protein [Acidobacteriota bacterium]
IATVYPKFVALRDDRLLRHAMNLIRPMKSPNVAPDFATAYAALETIVLWHRRRKGLEYIIEKEDEWNALRDRLGKFLKQDPLLTGDKGRRAMIKNKLGELRRAPFSAAFEDFCREYSVDLNDLWPVVGKAREMPLSEIRNRIVHGVVFDRTQIEALHRAGEHLRWTIERMLLAIFGWPVDESNVRPEMLRIYFAKMNLDNYRRAMRTVSESPLPNDSE